MSKKHKKYWPEKQTVFASMDATMFAHLVIAGHRECFLLLGQLCQQTIKCLSLKKQPFAADLSGMDVLL